MSLLRTCDMRSDTVTRPTAKMRAAMAEAEVGDDVMREDPTVNRLEALAAEKMGKEAGLLVTSGTQGNLIAMLTHCGRGDEVIVGAANHTVQWEVAGAAALGSLQLRTVEVLEDGTYDLDEVRGKIRGKDVHFPDTRLVCVENTHGGRGGAPLPLEFLKALRALADERDLLVHCDGARIWNAAVALGVSPAELVAGVDTVTFCLSKGLGAPVGSVLCGTSDFVERARRVRKMLGAGMRQVGVLAAAGIVAIQDMTPRLGEDHARAKRLGDGLAAVPGVHLDHPIATNMVFFSFAPGIDRDALGLALANDYAIKLNTGYARGFRAVVHFEIDDDDVDRLVAAVRALVVDAAV